MQMRFSSFLSSSVGREVFFFLSLSLSLSSFARPWFSMLITSWDRRPGNIERLGNFFLSFFFFLFIDDKMDACDKSIILFGRARATNRIIRCCLIICFARCGWILGKIFRFVNIWEIKELGIPRSCNNNYSDEMKHCVIVLYF